MRQKTFPDYTVRLEPGVDRYTIERDADGVPFKVFYQVQRWPGRREFVLVVRDGLTAKELAQVEQEDAPMMLDGLFQNRAWKTFRRQGKTVHALTVGYPVEDPLIALELEMMLDLEQTRGHTVAV